jgi:hypothetical protein
MDIINDFEVQFYKSLRLLDLGKTEQAAKILENVVAEVAKMQNNLFFIRASCVLGELLFATGKYDEARRYLTKVIETPCQDDVVDYEKNLAEDILGRL